MVYGYSVLSESTSQIQRIIYKQVQGQPLLIPLGLMSGGMSQTFSEAGRLLGGGCVTCGQGVA